MTINKTIENIKELARFYRKEFEFELAEEQEQIASWLTNYKHMRFQIGEVLVDFDKQHISSEAAIEKIRDIERKFY